MFVITLMVLLFSQQYRSLKAADIVFLTPASPKSHFMFLTPYLQSLLNRGHSVTFTTSSFPLDPTNFTIHKTGLDPNFFPILNKIIFQDHPRDPFTCIGQLEQETGVKTCSDFIRSESIKNLIRSKKRFDIAVATSLVDECTIVIGQLLAHHVVFINFMRKMLPVYARITGVPAPYSFVSHTAIPGFDALSFGQRFSNAFKSGYHSNCLRDYKSKENIIKDEYPQAMRFHEASNNLALVFNNGDPVLSEKDPTMPYVVNIGGMHCKPAKPLPEDLNKIVEDSGEDGFILFSLGTVIETDFIGSSITTAFVEAFSRFNHTVIWKTAETISGLSKNVKLVKWSPQQDLLGHPKIRLFISQGGIFGMQEALYHGVPVLGFPVFMDQFSNVDRLATLGCGKSMNIFNVTADELHAAILEMLSNPRFKIQMKKYSDIFRDQTESPLDRAVYWTEYLLHHKDLSHLKNPTVHLNNASYFLLDVLAFWMTVISVLLVLCYLIIFKRKT